MSTCQCVTLPLRDELRKRLRILIAWAGSQRNLARMIHVNESCICLWLSIRPNRSWPEARHVERLDALYASLTPEMRDRRYRRLNAPPYKEVL